MFALAHRWLILVWLLLHCGRGRRFKRSGEMHDNKADNNLQMK